MKIVRINEEGQITIPSSFREALKLKANMKLCVYMEDRRLIIESLSDDPIQALFELMKEEPSLAKDINYESKE
ncbi:MAG TPA: AbrB/MazE/SpoVT family DNA-binding domain-containing protein [Candidatus Eremiobacteraeota bacterium]|nr:AbrB/MazE/SpoVT family DNA-binding domain-containing protein [Candidatus Eremiobacteraeota bacterium]